MDTNILPRMRLSASFVGKLDSLRCRYIDALTYVSTVEMAMAVPILQRARSVGVKLIFIGNGGSAAIASHMAIDYQKNGGMRALAFNDAAALTCLANDLGHERGLEHQVDAHAYPQDVLVAVSSSGQSVNILNATRAAARRGCSVITLSGFDEDNPLRMLGGVNFHVPSRSYGIVELAHLFILHAMLDAIIEENRITVS